MYFITMLEDNDISDRCVGYFKDFDTAEEAVMDNWMDICESCYTYAVIENIPDGLYQYDTASKWYKYNENENRYEKCEKPEWASNIVGFAIG